MFIVVLPLGAVDIVVAAVGDITIFVGLFVDVVAVAVCWTTG